MTLSKWVGHEGYKVCIGSGSGLFLTLKKKIRYNKRSNNLVSLENNLSVISIYKTLKLKTLKFELYIVVMLAKKRHGEHKKGR